MENPGTTIAVIYDDGVFKPQEPVPASVKPHQILHVHLPDETESVAVSNGDDDASGWNNLMALKGCITDDTATDVARNHDKYLYGKS